MSAVYSNLTVGTWSSIPSVSSSLSWTAIAVSFSGQYQYSIADEGYIYVSADYGVSWDRSNAPQLEWVDVTTSSNGNFVAGIDKSVDKNGQSTLHVSEDYGVTWSNYPIDTSLNDHLAVIDASCTGQYIATMGNASMCINTSDDYGQTWNVPGVCTGPIIYTDVAVSCTGLQKIAVAVNNAFGNGGGIYIDSGGGFPTAPTTVSTNNHITSCAINSNGQIMYAVDSTEQGGLYRSLNWGQTWTKLITSGAVSKLYFDVVVTDQTAQHIVLSYGSSTNGYSYASQDGGGHWQDTWTTVKSKHVFVNNPVAIDMAGSGAVAMAAGWTPNSMPITSQTPTNLYAYTRCPLGYTVDYVTTRNGSYSCVPCPSGTYLAGYDYNDNVGTCTLCPMGTYNNDPGSTGEASCLECPFPLATDDIGSKACDAVYIGARLEIQLSLYAAILAWFMYVILKGNQQTLAAFSILVFPLLDVFTDFAYLVTSKFYNTILFILCAVMFLHPTPLFLYKLVKYEAYPTAILSVWWLGYSTSALEGADTRNAVAGSSINPLVDTPGSSNAAVTPAVAVPATGISGDHIPFPTISGRRFEIIVSFQSHSNIFILAWEMFTWLVAILAQMVTLLVCPIFIFVWFWVGVFLQMSKTIALSSVWNFWFYVWTGTTRFDDIGGGFVDTEELNYGLLSQFLLETIPHLVLQSANNTLLNSWSSDPVAIASFAASTIMAFNAIYHYFYHSHVLAEPLNIKDVPLDRSIRVGCCGSSYVCLDAKLKSYSKVIAGFDSNGAYLQVPLRGDVEETQRDEEVWKRHKPQYSDPLPAPPRAPPLKTAQDPMATAPIVPPPLIYSTDPVHIPTATAIAMTPGEADNLQCEPAVVVRTDGGVDAKREPSLTPSSSVILNSKRAATVDEVVPAVEPEVAAILPPRAPPPQLLCPLSHRLMMDPVIAEDGYTYERADIERYIQTYQCSPVTHATISSASLVPNRIVQALIVKYKQTGSM